MAPSAVALGAPPHAVSLPNRLFMRESAATSDTAPLEGVLALALSVAGDATQGEREALATRAMALLRQAVAGGLTDVDLYRTDSDLDSLRGRDDFRHFMKSLAAPARTKPQ